MKVLLTGGTGFLGKNVARALHGRGHDLRVLAREGSNLEGLPAHERAAGDVCDAESLRRAAEGCQAVMHMAALVKVWVPEREEFERVNVDGLRREPLRDPPEVGEHSAAILAELGYSTDEIVALQRSGAL